MWHASVQHLFCKLHLKMHLLHSWLSSTTSVVHQHTDQHAHTHTYRYEIICISHFISKLVAFYDLTLFGRLSFLLRSLWLCVGGKRSSICSNNYFQHALELGYSPKLKTCNQKKREKNEQSRRDVCLNIHSCDRNFSMIVGNLKPQFVIFHFLFKSFLFFNFFFFSFMLGTCSY